MTLVPAVRPVLPDLKDEAPDPPESLRTPLLMEDIDAGVPVRERIMPYPEPLSLPTFLTEPFRPVSLPLNFGWLMRLPCTSYMLSESMSSSQPTGERAVCR